jgi:hypothetical protein
MSPSGDLIIIPTPPAFLVDEPSVWIVHRDTHFSSLLVGSSSLLVNSATKSANA